MTPHRRSSPRRSPLALLVSPTEWRRATELVDEIFRTEHVDWETTLAVGDVEFHHTKAGPFPNHQLRVSVRPATGYAALNYMDHDDPDLPIANSFNPRRPLPEIRLIFSLDPP